MTPFRIATILLLAFSLASCANTIRGIGRDINDSANAVGDAIAGG